MSSMTPDERRHLRFHNGKPVPPDEIRAKFVTRLDAEIVKKQQEISAINANPAAPTIDRPASEVLAYDQKVVARLTEQRDLLTSNQPVTHPLTEASSLATPSTNDMPIHPVTVSSGNAHENQLYIGSASTGLGSTYLGSPEHMVHDTPIHDGVFDHKTVDIAKNMVHAASIDNGISPSQNKAVFIPISGDTPKSTNSLPKIRT